MFGPSSSKTSLLPEFFSLITKVIGTNAFTFTFRALRLLSFLTETTSSCNLGLFKPLLNLGSLYFIVPINLVSLQTLIKTSSESKPPSEQITLPSMSVPASQFTPPLF